MELLYPMSQNSCYITRFRRCTDMLKTLSLLELSAGYSYQGCNLSTRSPEPGCLCCFIWPSWSPLFVYSKSPVVGNPLVCCVCILTPPAPQLTRHKPLGWNCPFSPRLLIFNPCHHRFPFYLLGNNQPVRHKYS